MNCTLCRRDSGSEPLCDACTKEYFAHDCVSCGAMIIQLRGPVSGRCMRCSDPATVGPLPDRVLSRIDAHIADGSSLDAYKLIMESTPYSLNHAVRFVEKRKRELKGAD